jgi:regulator of protease activity HflC (stomatin/prohibitin superfamily)
MLTPGSLLFGVAAWFFVRFFLTGFFTVDPNERAVKTVFGRAQRAGLSPHSTRPWPSSCVRTSGNVTSILKSG